MRFRDLLLEYDTAKTAARFGAALWQALIRKAETDRSSRHEVDDLVLTARDKAGVQRRAAFLTPEQKRAIEQMLPTMVIRSVEDFDPSPNKQYMPWLITRFINDGIARFEDFDRSKAALNRFNSLKMSGFFKRAEGLEHAEKADIGRFKTLSDLVEFLNSLDPTADVSNSEAERRMEQEFYEKGQAELLFNDHQWKVVIPHTEPASCFFGRNTQWCTAATDSWNAFDDYAEEGNLYVILHKPTNRRWQFHFESGQFMDEQDRPINWTQFPTEFFEKNVFDYDTLGWKALNESLSGGYAPSEVPKMIANLDFDTYLALVLKRIIFERDSFGSSDRVDTAIIRMASKYASQVVEHRYEMPTAHNPKGSVLLLTSEDWKPFVVAMLCELDNQPLNLIGALLRVVLIRKNSMELISPDNMELIKFYDDAGYCKIMTSRGIRHKMYYTDRGSYWLAEAKGFPGGYSEEQLKDLANEDLEEAGEGWESEIMLARAILKSNEKFG